MNLIIKDLSKSYHGVQVLRSLSREFQPGRIYCLMGASGSGKTTLLRILLGLEDADHGTITGRDSGTLTAVFQENRLCETFTPLENIRMAAPKGFTTAQAREELCQLLPEECLMRPVSTLSGGMKRRVAICRALTAAFDGCLMDEPFTGLDEDTKQTVITYIKNKSRDKLLLITTHQEEDIRYLGGILVTIPGT